MFMYIICMHEYTYMYYYLKKKQLQNEMANSYDG